MSSLAIPPQEVTKPISFKRILVGTDFSETSRRALVYALALAKRYGAELRLLHALRPQPQEAIPDEPLPGELSREELQAKRDLLEFEQVAGIREFPHKDEIVSGDVADVLSSVIDRDQPDLLVLGTHGRAALKKLALGSLAEQAVRVAPCPVLTVGPHVANPSGTEATFKSILFATDFGAASLRAFPLALAIAEEYGAKLVLVHMIPPVSFADVAAGSYGAAAYSEGGIHAWHGQLSAESLRKLHDLIPPGTKLASTPVCSVETSFLPEGILEAAAVHKSELIVLGANETRSPRVAAHLPWAVLHHVVCEAHCPVLTVRSQRS